MQSVPNDAVQKRIAVALLVFHRSAVNNTSMTFLQKYFHREWALIWYNLQSPVLIFQLHFNRLNPTIVVEQAQNRDVIHCELVDLLFSLFVTYLCPSLIISADSEHDMPNVRKPGCNWFKVL